MERILLVENNQRKQGKIIQILQQKQYSEKSKTENYRRALSPQKNQKGEGQPAIKLELPLEFSEKQKIALNGLKIFARKKMIKREMIESIKVILLKLKDNKSHMGCDFKKLTLGPGKQKKLSRKTRNDYLNRLVDAGWIKREDGGKGMTSIYSLSKEFNGL